MPGIKRTTDLKMPKKADNTNDLRYKYPQFVRKDERRDFRTTPTHRKKQE